MERIETRYGSIEVTGVVERYAGGAVLSLTPAGRAVFDTPLGRLEAQRTTDDLRRRTVQSVLFHKNGVLKSLPLEQPTRIDTPAGSLEAELVTFHPDGSPCRVFPLNGKLSGYWTQDDEGGLARPVTFRTPLGQVTARIIALCFYPPGTDESGGALRSITLWPGDTLAVPTPVGELAARVGLSFRPDGSLRCLEPARPQSVPTPVGKIMAFDLDAVGINGDRNSLAFAPDGTVERVATSLTRLIATHPDGRTETFSPGTRESLCGDADVEPVPLLLEFSPEAVTLRTTPLSPPTILPTQGRTFCTEPFLREFANPFGVRACGC